MWDSVLVFTWVLTASAVSCPELLTQKASRPHVRSSSAVNHVGGISGLSPSSSAHLPDHRLFGLNDSRFPWEFPLHLLVAPNQPLASPLPILGALDGGPQCRMSILRNGNVACLCRLFSSASHGKLKKLICPMSLHVYP